ncbi:MAG: C39 family peptidase, partial [Anaerolineaceae bacterium]|nr:C39 family peptidase [Anaerolineaceae bacterium]
TLTNTPLPSTPEPIPNSAKIENISGKNQLYSLSCEASSAVDLAAYYGVFFHEVEFQERLPISDDPEEGFVGHYNGLPGQIPPNSYGVHAQPVADLLNEFGLNVFSEKGLSLKEIKREIASGDPVMVWVIGQVQTGYPITYTASNSNQSEVAAHEHTVLVIGYDENNIYILDGNNYYKRSIDQFLISWGVLDNMGIVVK